MKDTINLEYIAIAACMLKPRNQWLHCVFCSRRGKQRKTAKTKGEITDMLGKKSMNTVDALRAYSKVQWIEFPLNSMILKLRLINWASTVQSPKRKVLSTRNLYFHSRIMNRRWPFLHRNGKWRNLCVAVSVGAQDRYALRDKAKKIMSGRRKSHKRAESYIGPFLMLTQSRNSAHWIISSLVRAGPSDPI